MTFFITISTVPGQKYCSLKQNRHTDHAEPYQISQTQRRHVAPFFGNYNITCLELRQNIVTFATANKKHKEHIIQSSVPVMKPTFMPTGTTDVSKHSILK